MIRRKRRWRGRKEKKIAASGLYIQAGSRSYRTPSVAPAVDTNLRESWEKRYRPRSEKR